MDAENFDGILLLTRIGTHLWKDFCVSVATKDARESNTLNAALETLATAKTYLNWFGKTEERKQRRLRAAMIHNAKTDGAIHRTVVEGIGAEHNGYDG